MLAHRLRHRVHFQRPVYAINEDSGARNLVSWETAVAGGVSLSAVPAEVLTGPGRELLAAGEAQAETAARITMRWLPVDRVEIYTWRALWDGRVFSIDSAETDRTARREWRLRCLDGVSGGR